MNKQKEHPPKYRRGGSPSGTKSAKIFVCSDGLSHFIPICLLLTGCATTDDGYYQAETQRHLAAASPIFECQKCEGVVVRSQIPSTPTPKPTNGYDMVMGITGNLINLANQNGAVIGMGLLAKSLKTVAQPGDIITNTTTTTSSASMNNEANQANSSTQTYSDSSQQSSSQSLQNSGQIAGGNAADTHSPVSTTTTITDNSERNPVTTTSYSQQAGTAP